MRALRSLHGCCVALLVVCLLLAGAAVASADVEPNDVISQAEGPIAGGVPINGTIDTPDDTDYYYFYVQGQQQIHVRSTGLSGGFNCSPPPDLEDASGSSLPLDYTTPSGLNLFFLRVGDNSPGSQDELCDPGPYTLEVDPGSAVVQGPALDHSFVQTGEPNESAAQAEGPLAGGVNYRGSIDTANDQDWFYFNVAPGTHQLDVTVTNPERQDCTSGVTLADALDQYGDAYSASGNWDTFGQVAVTLTGPAVYHLNAGMASSSCFGAWQFRIDPPGAVTPTLETAPPPAPPAHPAPRISTACKQARSRVRAWSHRVKVLTAQLHHAHGAHSRHVLRVYLKTARRHLASAVAQRRRHCPGGR